MNLIQLETRLENIEFFWLITFTAIELGIDFCNRNPRSYRDTVANIAVAIGYQLSNVLLGYAVAFIGLEFFSQLSAIELTVTIPTTILAIAIADFIYYWEHRIEHQVRFFWAYHNVHHSSTDYNLTVAARLSWIETYVLWIFYIPMALLGFDPLQILIAVQIVAVYQTWIHTQKIGKLGILEKIINTPALHRVHHAANPRYIDKNFGGILIIWDRLFSTYQPEWEAPVYGLTKNINTHNPLKINTIEYQHIWKNILRSQNWKERYRSIFGSPRGIN